MEILSALADLHEIPPYQQERMKIDGMYKLTENKKVVDEYKDILIAFRKRGGQPVGTGETFAAPHPEPAPQYSQQSLRHLDELLLKDMKIIELEEPDYIRETRAICEGFFLKTGELRSHIGPRTSSSS